METIGPSPLVSLPPAPSHSSLSSSTMKALEGELKQQTLDDTGMYDWERKKFVLRIDTGVLEMHPVGERADGDGMARSQLSLAGAIEAKLWAATSAAAMGYGFDVAWSTGKLWSFLADDEVGCQTWVEAINESIRHMMVNVNRVVDDVMTRSHEDLRNVLGMASLPPTERQHSAPSAPLLSSGMIHRLNESDTTADEVFRSPFGRIDGDGNGTHSGDRTVPRYQYQTHTNAKENEPFNVSGIPRIPVMGSTSPSQASEDDEGYTAAGSGTPSLPPRHDGKKIKFETQQQHHGREPLRELNPNHGLPHSQQQSQQASHQSSHPLQLPPQAPYTAAAALELEALRVRVQQLVETLEIERSFTDEARKDNIRLQSELDATSTAFERHTQLLRQKEREAFIAFQSEMHVKIAQAVNDRDSLHDATLRTAEEHLKRDIYHLREELTEERKRFAEKVGTESRLREAAEGREGELQRECERLRETNSRLTRDVARGAELAQADGAAWTQERAAMMATMDERALHAQAELHNAVARGQADLRQKIKELTDKFQTAELEARNQIRATMDEEMLAERVRVLSGMEQQCARDVEKIRNEERQHGSRELAALKKLYVERESQTSRDLIELEKLHEARVRRLEEQVAVHKKRAGAAVDQLDVATRQMNLESEQSKSVHSQYYQQLETNAKNADHLAVQLAKAHDELQHAREREASYRAQLTQVLEDARVKNAELIELQRQASDGSAQAFHWRRAMAAADAAHAQNTTNLQIARDEVNLLEHELRRVKADNQALQGALEQGDARIYGARGARVHGHIAGGRDVEQGGEPGKGGGWSGYEESDYSRRQGQGPGQGHGQVSTRSSSAGRGGKGMGGGNGSSSGGVMSRGRAQAVTNALYAQGTGSSNARTHAAATDASVRASSATRASYTSLKSPHPSSSSHADRAQSPHPSNSRLVRSPSPTVTWRPGMCDCNCVKDGRNCKCQGNRCFPTSYPKASYRDL